VLYKRNKIESKIRTYVTELCFYTIIVKHKFDTGVILVSYRLFCFNMHLI